MFIKSLRLVDTVNNVVMREATFHGGANLVVDSELSERHNKVGKTTFLKLIDVLLGASGRDRIYKDETINSLNKDLLNIIQTKQVIAQMTLADSLSEAMCCKSVDLAVELFAGGHYYYEGDRVSFKEYQKRLRNLLFSLDSKRPSLRELIKSFVRISLSGDNEAFLRTQTQASTAIYRSIYNYLFAISDPNLDAELNDCKKEYKQVDEAFKQYKKITNAEDKEKLEQVRIAIEREYDDVSLRLNDILNSDDFEENRAVIEKARAEYAAISDELSEIDYRISRNCSVLEEARNELMHQTDPALVRGFYEEIHNLLPDLNRTFEDLVAFNRRLCENKVLYFEERTKSLADRREELVAKRSSLIAENKRYFALLEKDAMGEYEALLAESMRFKQELGKIFEEIKTIDGYTTRLNTLKEKIDEFSTGGIKRESEIGKAQSRMDSFNGYFTPMASYVNGERPILVYSQDTDKFPVSIAELDGSSTGTRKSLLAVFDLSYQKFAIANGIVTPRFIVHDVVENVEGDDLKKIVEVANQIECQFIFAVLKEKLDSSGIPKNEQENMRVLELSKEDRLFQGKTVDEAERHRQPTLDLEVCE